MISNLNSRNTIIAIVQAFRFFRNSVTINRRLSETQSREHCYGNKHYKLVTSLIHFIAIQHGFQDAAVLQLYLQAIASTV